jgi:hypothetical protein
LEHVLGRNGRRDNVGFRARDIAGLGEQIAAQQGRGGFLEQQAI